MTPLRFCNRGGFPCLESVSVNLNTTAETFSFNPHPYFSNNFSGGLFVKISGTNTAPTPAVPIQFATQGVSNSEIPVLNQQGTAYTTATWPGDGIYLLFFDRDSNKLYML